MITLIPYAPPAEATALAMIQGFWLAHNGAVQTEAEARADLAAWTAEGHRFYLIAEDELPVGFVHLGSRGGACDWLEDLFVLPAHQNRGIGTEAVRMTEKRVRQYSPSLYIEAAARNRRAIALYHRLGYRCLNTVTVRKDFPGYDYEVRRQESIYGLPFEIRAGRQAETGAVDSPGTAESEALPGGAVHAP